MKRVILYSMTMVIASLFACQKEFLDVKPTKEIVVPTTLANFQALLDNISIMNATPTLTLLTGDEYTIIDNGLQKFSSDLERDAYLWKTDQFKVVPTLYEWYKPYQQVFYANVVLDGLEKNKDSYTDKNEYNKIKGSALFYRARAFYYLLLLFSPAYDEKNGESLVGIALRLTADVNLRPERSTMKACYKQVTDDLEQAAKLLPDKALTINRASAHAAKALLARVYLTMGRYTEAGQWAQAAYQIANNLIDYNTIPQGVSIPFPDVFASYNEEIIFAETKIGYNFTAMGVNKVNNEVLSLFSEYDLRPKIFFYMTASGSVNNKNYDGIANDEIYLILAECWIRQGKFKDAADIINKLGAKRYVTGKYIPVSFTDETSALKFIIDERRKELYGRGTSRWADLKRFNLDPRFAKDLHRIYNGESYELKAGSPLYVFSAPL